MKFTIERPNTKTTGAPRWSLDLRSNFGSDLSGNVEVDDRHDAVGDSDWFSGRRCSCSTPLDSLDSFSWVALPLGYLVDAVLPQQAVGQLLLDRLAAWLPRGRRAPSAGRQTAWTASPRSWY